MRSWTIAFSVGVLLASRLPVLPDFRTVLAMLLLALLLHWWPRLRLLASALLGTAWLCLVSGQLIQQRWPEPPFPRDVWVEATVWTLPTRSGDAQRFQAKLDKVCLSAALRECDFAALPVDGRLALISVYEPLPLQPGQHWRWRLRLKPPHGFVNPGGFDYEAWLLQQRFSATGYVSNHRNNELLQQYTNVQRLEQWRFHLAQTLARVAAAKLQRPDLLKALTLGDGSDIPDADWQLFAATGTTHLLVISGSHVALISVLVYAVGYWLASRSAWLVLWCPATWPATLLALGGSWIYTGLAGFSLPALRAWIMVAVLLLAQLARRQLHRWHSLALALAAVLVLDPLAALNAGFWLSFAAVAVLLTSVARNAADTRLPWWQRAAQWLWQLWCLQWRISVALLPIVLVYFQQTSLLAPLVNLPLIPLLGAIVVPLALAGIVLAVLWPDGGLWLLQLADFGLVQTMALLHWSVGLLPTNMLTMPTLQPLGFALLLAGTLAFVLIRPWLWRMTALLLVPLVFWWQAVPPLQPGEVRLQVLDTGQGLAVVVSTANHHLLYDTGPRFSERFDAGTDVVLPVLRYMNVSRPDRVIISHADQDHAGGLPAVMREYPQTSYASSSIAVVAAAATNGRCSAGQHWQWDAVDFRILHPDGGRYDDNNGSCVLLIEAGGRRLLLTGDIERPVESALLRQYPKLQADVVVAPHHGSASSSSASFVRQLRPQIVVYSTGYQNRFGHPAAAVKARYQTVGALAWNTAYDGAIRLLVTPSGELSASSERASRPRFWRARPQVRHGVKSRE